MPRLARLDVPDLDDMIKKNIRFQVKGLILENYVTESVKEESIIIRTAFRESQA